jgi:hypothetical protein
MSSRGFNIIGRRARALMLWMLELTVIMTSDVLISGGQTVPPALPAPSTAVMGLRGTIAFRDVIEAGYLLFEIFDVSFYPWSKADPFFCGELYPVERG